MAGTINLSLSQQFDALGNVLAEGRLYFYRAGTVSTPQNAFYDADLTLPLPNPFTLDAAGRIPQFFLADGSIKVVLIDRHGNGQISADNILVIGPSGGGGGGGSVDPTTLWQTGQFVHWYGTENQTGWVPANGETLGSATSGATGHGNADARSLFIFNYNADPNLAVSGGRGGLSALDAWNANKTIAMPDLRGRALAGLDDMGNSAAGRLTAPFFGTAATVLGAAGGSESRTLTLAQIPPGITSAVTGTQQYKLPAADPTFTAIVLTGSGNEYVPYWHTQPLLANNTISGAATSNNTGGAAHAIASPMMLVTIYQKL